MKRRAYESSPIPSQMEHENYAFGIRDYIRYENLLDSIRWDIGDFVDWVASDNPRTKYRNLITQAGGDTSDYPENALETVFYPTNKIRLPVNKENVIESGIVSKEDEDLIVDYIDIDLPESIITKNQIIMLDILANNDWKRPIYFTGGSYEDSEYIWMKDYLQLDGLVYKLVPIRTPIDRSNPYEMGRVDSDLMYDIVKKWSWGNSESTEIYHDPETRKNSISFRSNLSRLSETLIIEGQYDKAEEIIDLAFEKMPIDFYGYYSLWTPFIEGYYKIDKDLKAQDVVKKISLKYSERLNKIIFVGGSYKMPVHPDLINLAESGDSDAVKLMMKWGYEGSKKFIGGNPVERIIQSPRDISEILAVDLNACNNYSNGLNAAKKIQNPTLLIFGKLDKMVNLENGHKFADHIKNSSTHVIENCGHMIMIEKAFEMRDKILEFLN